MGQKNSKDELVYEQVVDANVEAVKALHRQGGGLEWVDKEGKTPLIVASMDAGLYLVAETLIQLGANVNAYCPGRHAGTPLHHAANRGLHHTVNLLLSNRANPFVRNDDCQSPLELARSKGFNNIVRAIEAHICYFSGEISELRTALGILQPLLPQRLSRKSSKKSWAVIVPCSLPNSRKPVKLELALYSNVQESQPRAVISLSKCKILEPKFQESDPVMTIFDESTKTRYKFLSSIEGDKQQLARLYNACKGVPQVVPSTEANAEAAQLATALNTTVQSAANNPPQGSSTTNYGGWGPPSEPPPPSKASHSGWADEPAVEDYNGWAEADSRPTTAIENVSVSLALSPANPPPQPVSAVPSAPPLPDDDVLDSGPVQFPEIDMGPVDFPASAMQGEACTSDEGPKSSKTEESCCVICWEAPIEGACIPCGHMAGCMSCLTEIKAKKGVCPVCRTKIDQLIKLYAV